MLNNLVPIVSLRQGGAEIKKSDALLLAVALCTVAIASFVFLYTDMVDMATNSNLLLKSIIEGEFLDYYTYTLEHSTSAFAANYDFILYLIFAIWNLPFALIFHFATNGFVLLWFKVLVVLCILLCSFLMYKIYKLFDEGNHFTMGSFLILMLTSPFVFLGEFVAGQYDCISMVLILAGLYEYLKEREFRSILFFCLAIPIKMFAIFLFIPLLVYKEKNVAKILLKLSSVFIIPFCCKLLFQGDSAYSILLGAQNRDATKLLTAASIEIFNIEIHVFILFFLVLCFACYFCQYNKNKVLLIAASVYTAFIVFIPIRSYWVFLAEPFLILLLTTRPKLYKVNFLTHTVATISGSIFFLYFHEIYNSSLMVRSFALIHIWKLPDVVKYGNFNNFINLHEWGVYMPLLRTIFIGSCIVLIIINAINIEKLQLSSEISIRALSWTKCTVVTGILAIMIFVEVFPCSLPVIDTLNYSEAEIKPYINYKTLTSFEEEQHTESGKAKYKVLPVYGENETPMITGQDKQKQYLSVKYYSADINSGAVIEQPFVIKKTRTVSEIYFQCYNTYPSRWSRVRVSLSIVGARNQQVFTETIVGGSLITTGDVYIAKFKEVNLPEGDYIVRITNIESPQETQFTGAPIYIMCNTDSQNAQSAFIDGQEMEFPVCICLN